jgi:hypothetical protein
VLSLQGREELAGFLSSSVLPKTNRIYGRQWTQWVQFLKSELDEEDPYLTSRTQDEKSALVCRLFQRRHQAGHRGKGATGITAGIRQGYAVRMISTDFLEAAVVATARAACLMKPDELRKRRDSEEGVVSLYPSIPYIRVRVPVGSRPGSKFRVL